MALLKECGIPVEVLAGININKRLNMTSGQTNDIPPRLQARIENLYKDDFQTLVSLKALERSNYGL